MITPFALLAFGIGLYEKIVRPGFKNLPTSEYIIAGFVMALLIASDIHFLKKILNNKRSQ